MTVKGPHLFSIWDQGRLLVSICDPLLSSQKCLLLGFIGLPWNLQDLECVGPQLTSKTQIVFSWNMSVPESLLLYSAAIICVFV